MSCMPLTKSMRRVFYLSWLVYFVGYLARLNYGAVMAEIILSEQISRGQAGLVSTGAAITYALGQIISGLLGDRFSPRLVIFFGILTSSLCNLFMPLVPDLRTQLFFWCVNGFAQAMLWPPMLRIFTETFRKEDLSKMYVRVSTSTTAGTIAVYLLASLCITLGSWRLVFYVCSGLGLVSSLLWLRGMAPLDKKGEALPSAFPASPAKDAPDARLSLRLLARAGIFLLAAAIFLHGILKDSVTTWMPSFIMDTYHLTSAASILSTVVMPIFSMLCFYVASFLNDRIFKNEVTTSAVFFGFAFLGSLGIRLFMGHSPLISLLFGTLITSAMYGANLMLITVIPGLFSRFGRASTLTGVLNACTYAGTAFSAYGIGALSDSFGWSGALWAWIAAAAAGTLLCVFAIRSWARFLRKL